MIYPTSKSSSYHVVTPTRRKILQRNYNSFASTTLKNVATRKAFLKMFGRILHNEVSRLCSTKSKSMLSQSPRRISDFHAIVNDSLNVIKTLF